MAVEVAGEILQQWGKAIRDRRRELGLSQEQLATRVKDESGLSCDQRSISGYELAAAEAPIAMRVAIAKALQGSYESLFSVDEVVA
jgi:transcriptional regulator with XRE-family HTH domain